MATVVGIKFKNSGKLYYFSPGEEIFSVGDGVITETARGVEYGFITQANKEVPDTAVVAPLKPILRKATEKDTKQYEDNLARREHAIAVANEKVEKYQLKMKVVDAEYTFDRSKVIIYFTAEQRIDFRELVKELASVLHLRIELRQIYERDDIKMRGALAACGRPCCCTTFLQDFEKVSIKMAKVQGLSLNPQKISGCCGKLMCCLKYENQYYSECFKKMPKVGSTANTPDGEGNVLSNDMLRQQVKVRVPLADGSYDIKVYPLEQINAREKQSEKEIDEEIPQEVLELEEKE